MTMVPPEKLPENDYHDKLYYPSSSFFPTSDTFISETSFGVGVGVMNNSIQGYEYATQTQSSDSLLGPSHQLKNENHYCYYYCYPPMAEDESRTTTSSTLNNEAASSSKEAPPHETSPHATAAARDEEPGWLQLSIGGHTTIGTNHKKHHHQQQDHDHPDPPPPHQLVHPTAQKIGGTGLVELDLLTGSTTTTTTPQTRPLPLTFTSSSQHHVHNLSEFRVPNPVSSSNPSSFLFHYSPGSSSSFPPPPPHPHHHHPQEIMNNNWAIRTFPPQVIVPANSSSSIMPPSNVATSNLMPFGSYFARPFPLQVGSTDIPGPSSGMRIVDAPRRPHSGIWFYLQASQNQAKEPFLPQIPKSYLRIKDQRTTVRLLMKYLVNKLKLDNESEIEITCRGQQLLPIFTLQHVRDNIWSSPRDAVTLLPESSTLDHVMVLHYGRSAD